MAKVEIQDLSGSSTPVTTNPYDGLISICNDDPRSIQERYRQHRVARNALQKDKILAENFTGWVLDEHLVKLDGPQKDSSYSDPRNCLVFWARPPKKIKTIIEIIQQKLQDAAPGIWKMPINNLHLTVLEVTHSLTAPEIEHFVNLLRSNCEAIADYPRIHRARLIKPMLSYDAAAIALSFVPAAGESTQQNRRKGDDDYTYHHLRRDVYSQITDSGVKIASRYVVPSAHLTIARFNTPNPFGDDAMDAEAGRDIKSRKHWVKEIDMINKWLEAEYWPEEGSKQIMAGGEWVIGEEKGLDFRKGALWYGGGESVYVGKGF